MNQKIESQNGVLEDITACTTGQFCLSDDPKMMELKSHTPARIGIGRTGSRYLTKAYLRFRADHAAANDAEIKSETVGGYSRALATGGESALSALNATDGAKKLLAAVCNEYLAHTGLLYRGGCPCTHPTL